MRTFRSTHLYSVAAPIGTGSAPMAKIKLDKRGCVAAVRVLCCGSHSGIIEHGARTSTFSAAELSRWGGGWSSLSLKI